MGKIFRVFDTPELLAEKLSSEIQTAVNEKSGSFFLSVSGGSTPVILFKELAHPPYYKNISWDKLELFWCDERCVPPDDKESNYGSVDLNLLSKVDLPEKNIHRVRGEDDPNKEAVRYGMDIEVSLPKGKNDLPVFDWILLGMGDDGHTASLFPGQSLISVYSNIAGVAQHPVSGQKRISLTPDVLNNARKVTFMVTGKNKSKILSEIINDLPGSSAYPSAAVEPLNGNLEFMIDKEAAFYL